MPDTTVESSSEIVKQKEAEIEKLRGELDKEKKRVENAQSKINEWGNEIGELRKERDELKKTMDEAKETIASLKNVVTKAPETKSDHTTDAKVTDENPDTVEKSLTEEQRKAGEEAFNALNNAEKLQYDSDPKFRLSFLKRLQESEPVIPKSPWKTAAKKKTEEASGYQSILDRVFQKKKQASFVPGGSQSGGLVFGKSKASFNEPPEDTRVH